MRLLKAFAVLAAQVYALFDTSGVETLTSENWDEKVAKDEDNAWVITFYADWCPYCKTFSEEYGAAVHDVKLEDKKIKFGAVDVMANRDLTKKFGIKRSPTVKIFGKDRENPEDYTGQRKTEDIVSHCVDFCDKNDFVTEKKEEAPKVEYTYNIDSIVKTISTAHSARVAKSKEGLAQSIKDLEKELGEKLTEIKDDYQKRLDALSTERKDALQEAYDAVQTKITDAKSENALSIANLDDEAITLIESIIAKHKEKAELSDYIDTLAKDWFTITWDQTNRRKIGEVVAPPVLAGAGYGYGVHAPAVAAGAGIAANNAVIGPAIAL